MNSTDPEKLWETLSKRSLSLVVHRTSWWDTVERRQILVSASYSIFFGIFLLVFSRYPNAARFSCVLIVVGLCAFAVVACYIGAGAPTPQLGCALICTLSEWRKAYAEANEKEAAAGSAAATATDGAKSGKATAKSKGGKAKKA